MRRIAWDLLREGRIEEAEGLALDGIRQASGSRGLLGWLLVHLEAAHLRNDEQRLLGLCRLAGTLGTAMVQAGFLREAAEVARRPDLSAPLLRLAQELEEHSQSLPA